MWIKGGANVDQGRGLGECDAAAFAVLPGRPHYPPTSTPPHLTPPRLQAPNLMEISGGANFFAKCDNGIVVHRDWSQLKEMTKETRAGRGRPPSAAGQQQSSPPPDGAHSPGGGSGSPAAADQQQQAGDQPFLGFCVDIQIQKVRNKTTGSRGVAVLEYNAASGRYHEVGQGPVQSAAAASGAGAQQQQQQQQQGERFSLAREGLGDNVEVTEIGGESSRVDDALLEARRDQEVLLSVKERVFDYTKAREQQGGGDEEEGWTIDT